MWTNRKHGSIFAGQRLCRLLNVKISCFIFINYFTAFLTGTEKCPEMKRKAVVDDQNGFGEWVSPLKVQ
jgi:hypothetical protein